MKLRTSFVTKLSEIQQPDGRRECSFSGFVGSTHVEALEMIRLSEIINLD